VSGPDRQAEARERLVRVDAAIGRLPEEQRVILSMATAGGLTSAQIGQALGEPAGDLVVRLQRPISTVIARATATPGPALAALA
jgi:DNA-directed RNA polymerase specialized sigma24 family protein